jgi:hypothetical protein
MTMTEGNGSSAVVEQNEDNVRTMSEARRISKVEMKRMQAYEERKRRLINKGMDPSKVDEALATEDYNNLPIERKFERLEKLTSQLFQGLQKDVMALRHNDGVIADAMDINLRAVARSLEKAGVTKEMQGEIIREVETELREEQRRRAEQNAAAQRADAEKARMEKEANTKTSLLEPEVALPAEQPAEATVFGG